MQRDHFNSQQAPVLVLPLWTHAKERKDLRDVIPLCTQGTGSPNAQPNTFRIASSLVQVAINQCFGKLRANFPG
jgi:hypothetical protein